MPWEAQPCGLRPGNPGSPGSHSEIAAEGLLALDHLEEKRGPVLSRLAENLEEVPVLVAVGEDPQPAQVSPVLANLADAVGDVLVVGVGCREEDDPPVLERLDGANDVLRLQRN